MSNRASFAAAIAAAGMLAVASAPAAEAATVSPLVADIDFGNVLLNTPVERTLVFEVDPLPAIPFANGQGNFLFSFVLGGLAGQCGFGPQCTVSFKFMPLVEGLSEATATLTFLFLGTQSEDSDDIADPIDVTVNLRGVGVVPIPGAMPLFLTGLGGLAYMSRRRKTAA